MTTAPAPARDRSAATASARRRLRGARSGRRGAAASPGRPARRLGAPALVVAGTVVLLASVLLSLAIGARTLDLGALAEALGGLLSGDPAGSTEEAVLLSRLDRTLIGLVVGVALGLSGTAMQGVTRNPLADPGLLGVNAGAALAVVLGLQLTTISTVGGYVWLALLGAVAAAVVVYAVSSLAPGGAQPLTMALAGAAVTAAVTSVVAGVLVSNEGALDEFRFWQVGSVAGRSSDVILEVLPLLVVALVIVALSGPVLDATALGADLERALGQRPLLARGVVAFGAVGLAAAAVALAGPVAFVGLVVPHVIRLVGGSGYRTILLGSAFLGPALVLLTDTLGRVVTPPSEVQVGIMTAVLGAPALIVLVRRTGVLR